MSTLWIRVLALSSIAELFFLCPSPNVPSAGAAVQPGYVLVWSDEFNGNSLDTSKWGNRDPWHVRGGRFANNSPDAISVANGQLTIRTYTGAVLNGTPHYTGMIQTGEGVPGELVPSGNKYMPRYGYIEASIDFDGESGMWHSYWVQTPNNFLPGPRDEHYRGMEMDIVEHKKRNGAGDLSTQAPSALHWMSYDSPVYPNTPNFWHAGGVPHSGNGVSLADGFHKYGLEWTPDYLKFYYDSTLVWTVNNTTQHTPLCPPNTVCFADPCVPGGGQSPCVIAPVPHVNEYILLCGEVAVDSIGLGPIPANGFGALNAINNPKMTVEYVRHYQLLVPPSNLTTTALSNSQINLSWTDNTYAEDGFKLERSTGDSLNFAQVATVPADTLNGTVTYLDTGLAADVRYYYRVRAYIGTNNSAYSNTANAITDVSPPAAVTNLAVADIQKINAVVSWNAPGDDGTGERTVEYDLRSSTSPITAANFNSATRLTTGPPQISGFPECRPVWQLTACRTYYFAVKSKDEAGNWSAISNVTSAVTKCVGSNIIAECPEPESDTVPPADVTDLSVPSVGHTAIAVNWHAPGDDGTTGTASEYDFRRSRGLITAQNFSSATRVIIPAPQAAGTQECRIVTGLSPATTYYFALKTRDNLGNWSGISNVVSAATVTNNWIAECDWGGGAAKQPLPNGEAPQLFSAPRPNPAHGATSFRISVPVESRGAKLRVGVYDVQGRRVRTLVDQVASPGPAQIDWNLRDDLGHRVASGLYMVRVNIGDTRKTFRLVVVR